MTCAASNAPTPSSATNPTPAETECCGRCQSADSRDASCTKRRSGTTGESGIAPQALQRNRKQLIDGLTERTGWPPGMLQDDSKELSKWLASKPDARQQVREACAQIRAERVK